MEQDQLESDRADRETETPAGPGARGPRWRTFLGLATDPQATFRDIVEDPPVRWAVGIVVVVSLLYGLNAAVAWGAGEQWMATFPAEAPPGWFAPGAALIPVVFWVLHPLIAGLLRLTARLFGGEGDYRGMFTAYAFALTPSALSVLGLLPDPFGWIGPLFELWSLMLVLYALRANERLSTPASLVVLALPLLVVAGTATAVLALT